MIIIHYEKDKTMKHISLSVILLLTFSFADVAAKPSPSSKPSIKPVIKASYDQLSRDDYVYNPLYNDKEVAEEKARKEKEEVDKKKMLALEKERKARNMAKQKELQKKNKAEYDKAMKAYENRKRNTKTENSIIISDEPVK